jgi:hypothetical protein
MLRIMALKGVICIEEPYGERTLGNTKVDAGVQGTCQMDWIELGYMPSQNDDVTLGSIWILK